MFFVAMPLLAVLFEHLHWHAAAWIVIGIWIVGCFLILSDTGPRSPWEGWQ